MNRAELIEAVTERIGDKRTAGAAVEAVLDVITRAVAAGEKVTLTGFGIFEKVERAARTARNPATGETVDVAETAVPKFRPGSAFKQVVADPRTLPAVAYDAAAAVQSQGRAGVGTVLKAGAAALAAGAAVAGVATGTRKGSTSRSAPTAGDSVKAEAPVAKKAPAATAAQVGAPGKGEAVASAAPAAKQAAAAKKTPAAKKAPAAKAPAAKAPAAKAPAAKAPAKKAAAAKAPAKKAAGSAKTQGDG